MFTDVADPASKFMSSLRRIARAEHVSTVIVADAESCVRIPLIRSRAHSKDADLHSSWKSTEGE